MRRGLLLLLAVALLAVVPGNAAAATEVSFSPSQLKFTAVTVGQTSQPAEIELTNHGSSNVPIQVLGIYGPAGGDFSQTNGCGPELEPGANCSFTVAFRPTAAGLRDAILSVKAGGTVVEAKLLGRGITTVMRVNPSSLDLGGVPSGSVVGLIELEVGTRVDAFKGGLEGNHFEWQIFAEPPCERFPMLPGEKCTYAVIFNPGGEAPESATFTLTSEPTAETIEIPLSGSGMAEPGLSIQPAEANFGAERVGVASAPESFTVSNSGSFPIQLESITAGLEAPANFRLLPGGCTPGTLLQPKQDCQLEVLFQPFTTGADEANLQVTGSSEAGEITAEATLAGNGLGSPGIEPSVSKVELGPVPLGSSADSAPFQLLSSGATPLTITRIGFEGPDAAQFRYRASGCTGAPILPGNSCSITVSLEPQEGGPLEASLRVESDAASSPTIIPLSGTGEPVPEARLTGPSESFPETAVGAESKALIYAVTSIGSGPLQVDGAALGGSDAADFKIKEDGCVGATVLPGRSCEILVKFLPMAVGPRSAQLEVSSDSAGGNAAIGLTGTGEPHPVAAFSEPEVDFGSLFVGESARRLVDLENVGTTPLTLSGEVRGGDVEDFDSDSECLSVRPVIPAGGSCAFELEFAPTGAGSFSGTVTVGSDSAGASPVVTLKGTAVALTKALTATPSSEDFGEAGVGARLPDRVVTVESSGDRPATVGAVEVTGADGASFPLDRDACTGDALAPGETCQVAVGFAPGSAGAKGARLQIESDAEAGSLVVPLTGTGTEAPGKGAEAGPATKGADAPPPSAASPIAPSPPPACVPASVAKPVPYRPRVKGKPNALGVRARFAGDGPAVVAVSASLVEGGHSTFLGKSDLAVAGGGVNLKLRLPRAQALPAGTPVTLHLSYRVRGETPGCGGFGRVHRESLRTKIAWVTVPAGESARAR
jgi:hypothetical protein